jgi:hypothetical protein
MLDGQVLCPVGEGVRARQHAHKPPAVQDGEVLLEACCAASSGFRPHREAFTAQLYDQWHEFDK